MSAPILGVLLDAGLRIIDKVIPDPQAKADANLKLAQLAQNGELAALAADSNLALAQVELNKVEAASNSNFKGGWRPFIGWVCGGGLFYQIIFRPIFGWVMVNIPTAPWTTPPSLDMETLLTILGGLLGLGGMRTYERVKGSIK